LDAKRPAPLHADGAVLASELGLAVGSVVDLLQPLRLYMYRPGAGAMYVPLYIRCHGRPS
jgi:hypothetical protein